MIKYVQFAMLDVLLALMERNASHAYKERVYKELLAMINVMMAIIQIVRFANNVMKHVQNVQELRILNVLAAMKDSSYL